MGGFLTKARAMESRCRCPPETLAPPWAISAAIPCGVAVDKVGGLRRFDRPPANRWQAGILIGVAQVALDGAGEERALLRDVADLVAQIVLRHLANV
jgi:hypothetical protein